MNPSQMFDLPVLPWWQWLICAAVAILITLVCASAAATGKRTGGWIAPVLGAVALMVALFCLATGIMQFVQSFGER